MKKILKQAAALVLCAALLITDIPSQYININSVYAAEVDAESSIVVDEEEELTSDEEIAAESESGISLTSEEDATETVEDTGEETLQTENGESLVEEAAENEASESDEEELSSEESAETTGYEEGTSLEESASEDSTLSESWAEDADFDGEYVLPGEQYYEDDWAEEIESEEDSEAALSLVTVSNIRLLGSSGSGNAGIMLTADEPEVVHNTDTTTQNWSFNIYYVNQSDQYYMEKSEDFTLKYQMEFHTSEDLAANSVVITIPKTLLTFRDGTEIDPSDIAVPKQNDDGSYNYNVSMPFNYYEDGDNLVFYNYRKIDSGSNIAWQVLYKGLTVMDIVDMTEWELQAGITVDIIRWDAENETDATYTQTTGVKALTGLVNTYVNLASVTKTALSVSGVSYTPGLYTSTQVSNYITYWVVDSDTYLNNMDDYVYVVWDVKIKGNGTQPYNLEILDTATAANGTVSGTVIGYKQISSTGYTNRISEPTTGSGGYTRVASDEENASWGTEFYVVTAYPASSVKAGTVVNNSISVKLQAADGIDADQIKSASAKWSYADYQWTYRGNIIGIDKISVNGSYSEEANRYETMDAYLKYYESASADGDDVDGLNFYTWARCYGYAYTHYTDNSDPTTLGKYISGTYYQITAVDDVLYAYASGETISEDNMLSDDDYYFTSVTFKRVDAGIDVWEDKVSSEYVEHPSGVDQNMTIYAMYEGSTSWTEVGTVDCSSGSTWTYSFTADQLANKPWRVKAVYNSVNYSTYCYIYVTVALRGDSDKLNDLAFDGSGNVDITSLQVENISGVMGERFADGASKGYFHDSTISGSNYSEEGLSDLSVSLYGIRPMRDSAFKTLTDLVPEASSYKTSSTQNDAVNNRTLVTYNLTAYDGYKVYNNDLVIVFKGMDITSPSRNYVVFYDLLPYGMQYDASYTPTAGRVTNISSDNYQTQYKSWTTSQVEITDVDVTYDWNGTGRTMVAFHVYYSGADSSSYSSGLWFEGWGVNFRAYYDWSDLDLIGVEGNANIAAFMPDAPVSSSDSSYKSYMTALFGLDTEVALDNGVIVPSDISGDYDPFTVGDINGDGITNVRNVLYAKDGSKEDVAIASYDSITKTVRADANSSDEYGKSAYVGGGENYTYNITVSTSTGLNSLVLFDRLEYAFNDRSGTESYDFESDYWYGTFVSVDTTGLELMGIEPVVYYNVNRNAVMPDANDETITIDDVFSTYITYANGWYTESQLPAAGYSMSDVKAIAIDCRNTSSGAFTLESMQSVSYQIHMQAPASVAIAYANGNATSSTATYAYNNASYYSYSLGTKTNARVVGNTVKVSLGDVATFEIVKEFAEEVPDAVADTEFNFTITTDKTEVVEAGQVIATTYTYFSERSYTLWEMDDSGEYVQLSGTYATDLSGQLTLKAGQKAVFENVPVTEIEDIMVEEDYSVFWSYEVSDPVENDGTYTITVANTYHPALYLQKLISAVPSDEDISDEEFQYQILYKDDNGDWQPLANTVFYYVSKIRTDGGEPAQKANSDGLVSGETDDDGILTIKYGEVIAVFMPKAGLEYKVVEISYGGDWVCKTDTKTGTMKVKGNSESITNIWKWKDLYLTKEITHQDAEDAQEYLAENDLKFTFRVEKVVGDDTEIVTSDTDNITWEMVDGSGTVIDSGEIDANGEFSAACAGYTIIIKHLEAEAEYIITEVEDEDLYLYVAASDTADIKMPLYSTSANATITNDWQKRPLSVMKYVAGVTDGSADDEEFTMYVTVNGTALSEFPYTVTKNGVEIRTGTTGTDGSFVIKTGEIVTFKDAGILGQEFVVTEEANADYPQIYPTDNGSHTGTFSGDGNTVTFVNGNSKTLMISKTYEPDDAIGLAYYNALKTDAELRADAAVTITITSDGNTWPTTNIDDIILIDTWEGTTTNVTWYAGTSYGDTEAGYSLGLEPGVVMIIPETDLSGSYTVTESASDQHKVFYWDDDENGGWIEVYQSYPENDEAAEGTMEANPVVELVNNVTGIDVDPDPVSKHQLVYKKMSIGSDEVPEGAELVWRLEYYDGSETGWLPASGVDYLVFDDGIIDDDHIVSTSVQTTEDDGLITLTKSANGYPSVLFVNDDDIKVYVNLYTGMETGDYRLVEVTDDSDESWGLLIGYETNTTATANGYDMGEGAADTFINSNRTAPLAVTKELSEGETSDETFTFVLTQVLATSDKITNTSVDREATEDDIYDSQIGANIPYTVYDAETGEEVSTSVTTASGRFYMKAGQYVVFDLPERTIWTISEVVSATTYDYVGVGPSDDSDDSYWQFHKLNDNLMLVNQKANNAYVIEVDEDNSTLTVTAGEDIDLDNLVVYAYPSDGSEKFQLGSDDFYIDPETAIDDEGEFVVTVYYNYGDGIATTTVTLTAIKNGLKYAVAIYGINEDTYVDSNANERTAGLTFGPATGANYTDSYVTHLSGITSRAEYEAYINDGGSEICLHWMTWDEIIAQSKSAPTVFQTCLESGCTHSVELELNSTIEYYNSYTNSITPRGDGASVLYNSILLQYRYWNKIGGGSTGGYAASRIRAVLNGSDKDTNASVAGDDMIGFTDSLISCFPDELQEAIVSKKVISGADGNNNVATTYDQLWLFSYDELSISYGVWGSNYEGPAYSKSASFATDNTLRIAYDETGSVKKWWTRSAIATIYVSVVSTNGNGGGIISPSSAYQGLAPGFCLAGPEEEPDVKYAVSLYGIQEDTYLDDSGNEQTAGLTFGPATGANYTSTSGYKSHLSGVTSREAYEKQLNNGGEICLHWMTWDEIIAQSKESPTVFQTCLENGCTKSVSITLNDTIGDNSFTSSIASNGDGASMLFNSINSDYRMWNDTNTNSGGWPVSKIRTTLNDTSYGLINCFPSELQEAIVAKAVKANTEYESTDPSYVTTTYDKLWLFSDNEIFGPGTYSSAYNLQYEGTYYSRMTSYATERTLRIGYLETGSAGYWWLRSPCISGWAYAYYVNRSGYGSDGTATSTCGLAPGFCLK